MSKAQTQQTQTTQQPTPVPAPQTHQLNPKALEAISTSPKPQQQIPKRKPSESTNSKPTILCPTCGIRFTPVTGNICPTCAIADIDIASDISKHNTLQYCRFCHRYLRPPWIFAERQSRQLLALCLKKIKNLNKLKIIDAGFVWTEPHSRRIKVKITVSKQLNNLSNVEQTFIVEFVEEYLQCNDCKKEFTPHTWVAAVQVRQHVEHKKTFFWLEQLILKHNAHEKVIKIEEEKDGVNFLFKSQAHAQRMVEFLTSVLPVSVEKSKQLISQDQSNNTYNYKYTYSVIIPKICKEDLIVIPKKLAHELGGCGNLLLCWKVSSALYLLDLSNYRTVILSSTQYFLYQHKIDILPINKFKSRFQVLDCQVYGGKVNLNNTTTMLNAKLFRLTIRALQGDAKSDNLLQVRCHLGDLHPGQIVQAVDLRYLNYYEWMNMNDFKGVDDVVVCRKARNPHQKKTFRLRRLDKEEVEEGATRKKVDKEANDYQEFLDDLAADKEMRKGVKMYVNQEVMDREGKDRFEEMLDGIEIGELIKAEDKREEHKKEEEQEEEEKDMESEPKKIVESESKEEKPIAEKTNETVAQVLQVPEAKQSAQKPASELTSVD